jgi:hypothetical protein
MIIARNRKTHQKFQTVMNITDHTPFMVKIAKRLPDVDKDYPMIDWRDYRLAGIRLV